MIFEIDLSSDAPLYLQIAAGVRGSVLTGNLVAGQRLPPGRELAAGLGVNLETVQRAYRLLVDEGLLVSRVGRGTRVVDDVDTDALALRRQISDLVDRAAELGIGSARLATMVRNFPASPS
ncbi:MAG: GntR family transcriptional regulator [Acidimicrobiia bacterium]|nr:GntR family transcriptional regulator [Acidimicrobiia bacterium]